MRVSPALFVERGGADEDLPTLAGALASGGIARGLQGGDPASALWARSALLLHLALMGLFIWLEAWVLIYLVTFGVFFASAYFNLCGAMQHNGLGESRPDWRLICNSFEAGPLTRWLYWNMNFHVEHHMYAAVPCHVLPKLRRAISPDLPPAFPSLPAGIRFLLQTKAEQARDPAHFHVPALPASPARG